MRDRDAEVEVLGVHPVDPPGSGHLVEMRVTGEAFALADLTQEVAGAWREAWPAPRDAWILDPAGERIVARASDAIAPGTTRFAFLLEGLDVARPLRTPWGKFTLPAPTERPARLASVDAPR